MTITLAATATPIQLATTLATTAYSGSQIRDLGQMLGRDRVAKTGAYTVVAADRGKTIDCTSGTFTVSLTAAATLANGFHVAIANSGSGVVTIDPNASETIRSPAGSATTLALAQGQAVVLVCDGAGWLAVSSAGLAPAAAAGVALLGSAQTFTAAQTFSTTSLTPALFLHPADSDMHVRFQSGLTADQRAYLAWWKQGGSNYSWLMGKNGLNEFINYDADGTTHRLHMLSGGVTRICSAGTASVAINNYGEATTGTGGFEVYSGGASPSLWFQVNSTGVSISTLTAGRVPYIGAAGLLADSAKLLYSDASPSLTLGSGVGAPALVIDGAAGQERRILFRTGGVGRWDFYVSGTAEGGANAGSDFVINARSDAGGTISTGLTITRAAGGAITLGPNRGLTLTGNIVQTGSTTISTGTGAISLNGITTLKANSLDRTVGGLAFTATATATVANTTTETSIISTGVGTRTLPANFLNAGRTIRVRVRGIMSDTGTPTLHIRVKMGSTTLVSTTALALSGTIVNEEFDAECVIVCRTAGATGTVMASGVFHYDNAAKTGPTIGMGATAAVTIDTTAAQTIDVTAQWGTASASNTISGQTCTVEVEN